MGKSGPPRMPTVRLAELGSHRAKTRAGKEPKPRDVKPKATIALTSAEREVFNQVCKLLADMKLRAASDGNAIARYAKNVVRYNVASEWIEKHGESYPVFENVNGEKRLRMMKRYPQSVVRHELELICAADKIPDEIVIDVTGFDVGDSIHISHVTLPEGSKSAITDRDFTIATVVAPSGLKSQEGDTTKTEGEA